MSPKDNPQNKRRPEALIEMQLSLTFSPRPALDHKPSGAPPTIPDWSLSKAEFLCCGRVYVKARDPHDFRKQGTLI